MRLAKGFDSPGCTVTYSLDVGGGMFSNSEIPATVALEIAQNAEELAICERNGTRFLKVNKRQWFPLEAFDLGSLSVTEETPTPKKRRTSRRKTPATGQE